MNSTLLKNRLANEAYHRRPELSSSQISMFIDDRVAWYYTHKVKQWPKPKTIKAMEFGTQVHEMLEAGGPDKSLFVEVPREVLNKDGHKKGKAWLQFKDAHPGAFFFNPGERCPILEIWENVNQNKIGVHLVEQERKEREVFWTDPATGIECKAKIDVDSDAPYRCIADWKTTRSIHPRAFQSDCHRMHYPERLALYRRGMQSETGEILPVLAFAIENTGSYRVQPSAFDIEAEMDKPCVTIDAPRWSSFDSEYEVQQ